MDAKNVKKLPLVAALALVLSACAVGPDYQRGEANLPETYATSSPGSDELNPLSDVGVNARWWELFDDAQLNELVETALVHNADIRLALARIEEADAYVKQAGATLLPSLDLNVSATSNKTRATGTALIRHPKAAGISMSYEIDLWGRVRRANEAVQAQLLASHYAHDAMRLTVAAMVASNYLTLRAADAQLVITADTLKTREESVVLTRNRVDAGLVSPIDYHQAAGLLAAAQTQEAEFRRMRALALHQLALMVGKPDLQIKAGDLRNIPLPPAPPAGLPAQLVENRPDVRQAEAQLIAANANIGLAKAAYFPQFTLTGSVGSESPSLRKLFSSSADVWSMALAAFMPILDFGRISAQVDAARAINKQSLITWQNTLQVAYKEVRDALVSAYELGIANQAAGVRVESARRVLEIAKIRYQAGHASYLELLDAERTHNEAAIALISIQQSRLDAAVSLFKALGGGWKPRFALQDGLFLHIEQEMSNAEEQAEMVTPAKSVQENSTTTP